MFDLCLASQILQLKRLIIKKNQNIITKLNKLIIVYFSINSV